MKKVFLMGLLGMSAISVMAQKSIFMEILENKKICNKEDQLTYFLQSSSFQRDVENRYYHRYAVGGKFYTTAIVNEMECYVVYQTDNAKDYSDIKTAITGIGVRELAADKSEYFVCNKGRIRDVQVIFNGYLEDEKVYEIKVYQNPEEHQLPYNQSDRIVPVAKRHMDAPAVKKRKARAAKVKSADGGATVAQSKNATPAAAKNASPMKSTAPVQKASAPPVTTGAPPVNVSKPKEATVKSVTPTPGKK